MQDACIAITATIIVRHAGTFRSTQAQSKHAIMDIELYYL